MIILGLLLAAAGAVFGLDLLWKNKFLVHDPSVFGQSLGITSGRWLFVLGAIVGAAIVLGVAMMLGGLGRKGAKAVAAHKDKKGRRDADHDRNALEAENVDLRRRLEEQASRQTSDIRGSSHRVGATRIDNAEDDPTVTRRI